MTDGTKDEGTRGDEMDQEDRQRDNMARVSPYYIANELNELQNMFLKYENFTLKIKNNKSV